MLAIPKPSHNITIIIYFANKALHQGFCTGCFFHTCRAVSPSLARRCKNKLCWWVICNPSQTHWVSVVLCYLFFKISYMGHIERKLTAAQRARHCLWQPIYAPMFPHLIPKRNKRKTLKKKQSKEKTPNQITKHTIKTVVNNIIKKAKVISTNQTQLINKACAEPCSFTL